MPKQKPSTRVICVIGLMCAFISVFSQISFPTATGIPFTLQIFAVVLAGIVLEAKYGTIAIVIYLLLGLIGLPVFSNFRGGFVCFMQPTGGFLLSFPLLAFFVGLGEKKGIRNIKRYVCYGLGLVCNFVMGALIFAFSTKATIQSVFWCVSCHSFRLQSFRLQQVLFAEEELRGVEVIGCNDSGFVLCYPRLRERREKNDKSVFIFRRNRNTDTANLVEASIS